MTDVNKTILSSKQLNEYRNQLKDLPEALEAIVVIESCDGDLESAADQMLRKYLLDSGALARHDGDYDAAMTEYLTGIK